MERNKQPTIEYSEHIAPSRPKLVFVAGPYTGPTAREVIYNIDQARWMCERLARAGIHFICPHTNSAMMENMADYEFWCTMYHNILLRCDALVLFGLWQRSNGTKREIELAELNNIPVFHNFPELSKWIKTRV